MGAQDGTVQGRVALRLKHCKQEDLQRIFVAWAGWAKQARRLEEAGRKKPSAAKRAKKNMKGKDKKQTDKNEVQHEGRASGGV